MTVPIRHQLDRTRTPHPGVVRAPGGEAPSPHAVRAAARAGALECADVPEPPAGPAVDATDMDMDVLRAALRRKAEEALPSGPEADAAESGPGEAPATDVPPMDGLPMGAPSVEAPASDSRDSPDATDDDSHSMTRGSP